jgi:uncharacterized membrane protein YccC
MMGKWGIDAAIFSLKCFIAAMLAMFVAFSIGLERPYWAFLTAYIISGPFAGAVVSRASFRLIGTLAGAAFSVLVVPLFVHAPVILVSVMACWLALCVFVSLLDRTPTSYIFALAGYTAGLIVWPTVQAPDHIFDVASLRAQEIAIGITCSALVHAVVFPRSGAQFLMGRIADILADAERWSRDTLQPAPDPSVDAERRRLAQDITELHQFATHLPFETNGPAPRIRVIRALEDNLAALMPLGAAIADRIAFLSGDRGLAPAVDRLIADARAWVADPGGDPAIVEETGQQLIDRCAALEPVIDGNSDWHTMMELSLIARLSGLIEAHVNCRLLHAQLASATRKPVSPRIPALLEGTGTRPLNRDVAGAVRVATGAALTVIIGCTLWIGSGWHDGGTFVMLASVFPALFGALDNGLAPVVGFLKGTAISVVLGAAYAFAILPSIDGFPEMVAALAPPLLVLGSMLSNPRYMGLALPALLGLGSPFIVSEQFGVDIGPGVPANFATFMNSQVAMMAAILFAAVMMRIMQTAGIDHAIRRNLRAGWTDIADHSDNWARPDIKGWIARMLDRQALLEPRLAAMGKSAGEPLYDILRDLRTGVAIGELRALRRDAAIAPRAALADVLGRIGAFYRRLVPHRTPPSDPALLHAIDEALRQSVASGAPDVRRRGVLALITLRRTMFADAAPFAGRQENRP